jgi:hypothetical protein
MLQLSLAAAAVTVNARSIGRFFSLSLSFSCFLANLSILSINFPCRQTLAKPPALLGATNQKEFLSPFFQLSEKRTTQHEICPVGILNWGLLAARNAVLWMAHITVHYYR